MASLSLYVERYRSLTFFHVIVIKSMMRTSYMNIYIYIFIYISI